MIYLLACAGMVVYGMIAGVVALVIEWVWEASLGVCVTIGLTWPVSVPLIVGGIASALPLVVIRDRLEGRK